MKGKTHRQIAPFFTAGVYYLTLLPHELNPTATATAVGVASAVSVLSANWSDGDLFAYRPIPAIFAGRPLGRMLGVKKVKVKRKDGRVTTGYAYRGEIYTRIRKMSMRLWAVLFRLVGVRSHRVWQSHSPILWGFITLWVYTFSIHKIGLDSLLAVILTSILNGLTLGYLSHLFGDLMTYKGLPLLPEFRMLWRIPILGSIIKFLSKIFSNISIMRFGFTKASNERWNKIVLLSVIIGASYIIFPDTTKLVGVTLYAILKEIILFIVQLAVKMIGTYK